jgi:hypothetical protein
MADQVEMLVLRQVELAGQVSSSSATLTLLRLLLQQQDPRRSPFLVASEFINGPHQGA